MRAATIGFLPLACLCPAVAQDAAQPSEATLRREVDGLVRAIDKQATLAPLDAARFLVALARCHRRYGLEDGPLVRRPLKQLFAARSNDGLFGTGSDAELRETTAWTHQALAELDAEAYASDLETTAAAFSKRFALSGAALTRALRPYDATRFAGTDPSSASLRLLAKVAAWELVTRAKSTQAAPSFAPFRQKALDWLLESQEEGIWKVPGPGKKLVADPGTTALCLAALATKPPALRSAKETTVLRAGMRFLLAAQRENGSFSPVLSNYITCAAVFALANAGIPDLAADIGKALLRARGYLLAIQNVETASYQRSDRDFGSIGYGGDRRGDLSNTQMALEALRLTGLAPEDEAFAKALVFLQRCQNLPGRNSYEGTRKAEDGRKVKVRAGEDGGSAYYPGVSFAGYDDAADGTQIPRSYGSMTYALLKCYVLAGMPKDDPRLVAALTWCTKNFTLEHNPGVKPELGAKAKYQGLYYYYLTLARALALAEVDEIAGKPWRDALAMQLRAAQHPDGSWLNEKNSRWYEGSPTICTAYALLALGQ